MLTCFFNETEGKIKTVNISYFHHHLAELGKAHIFPPLQDIPEQPIFINLAVCADVVGIEFCVVMQSRRRTVIVFLYAGAGDR